MDRAKLHALVDTRIDALPSGIPLPDLSDLPDGEIATSWVVGSASWSEGSVAIHSIFAGQSCGQRKILDVSGAGTTGGEGVAQLTLSMFHCYFPPPVADPGRWEAESLTNVVATARGPAPTYLTAEARKVTTPSSPYNFDFAIAIHSWKPSGKPRPSVRFDWRCRVIVNLLPG